MFAAVSIFVGQGMLEGDVARSGDVGALRRVLAAEDRFAPIAGGLFLLGIALGYVLAAVIFLNAFLYHIPTANRLKALTAASPNDGPSGELRAAIDAPIGLVMNVVDGVVWLAFIFVMVAKPFT